MATRKKFEVANLKQVEDFVGKELTSTEEVEQVIEQMVTEKSPTTSKPKLQFVRKNEQGQEVQASKKPAVKPAVKETLKKKTPKPKKTRATETVKGHAFVTIEMIEQVFADAAKGYSPKEIAVKYNLALARATRILTGSRGFAERAERRAKREGRPDWKYPSHPFVYPKPEKPEVEVGK